MRSVGLVPWALLAGGAAAVAAAVVTGGAEAAVVVVFPVIVGSSALLLLGVVLLIAGFLTLPWAWSAPPAPLARERTLTSGGLVLVGPIPIFWGAATSATRRTQILAAVAGALVLLVAVVLVVTWAR